MLFITNRSFNEGKISKKDRKVTFNLEENEPSASVFFCERGEKDQYVELGGEAFLERVRQSSYKQILLYIHGFNNLPEKDIFPRAESLQNLCNQHGKDQIQVIPMIWPCDADIGCQGLLGRPKSG